VNIDSTRVRPFFRWLAIACVIVLVPAAAHALWDYVEMRRLANAIDDLRQRGEPVSSAMLKRTRRPSSEEAMRAARYYNAAAALAFRDWVKTYPVANLPRDQAIERGRQVIVSISKSHAISPDAPGALRTLAVEYEDALQMVDRAADLPFTGFPAYFFEDNGRVFSLEDLTIPASARTFVEIASGNGAAAVESLYRSLRLRRALTRAVPWIGLPLLDLQMLLENTDVPAAGLAKLQSAVAEAERPDAVQQAVRENRANVIQTIWARLYGKGADANTPAGNIRISWDPWNLSRPWIAREVRLGLAVQQQVLEAAERPWPEKLPALAALAPQLALEPPADPKPGVDVRWFNNSFPWVYAREVAPAEARKLALTRAAVAVLAIARYRQQHGALPDGLDRLVPDYLAAVPEDPFTGRGLLYAADTSRFTVYSTGSDGDDNGGAVGQLTSGWPRDDAQDTGIEIRLR
jgi:hypothetical protein